MSNWAALPYEILKLIVEILIRRHDQKSLVEFQVVCKHWHKPAAYVGFSNVKVTNLDRLSTLARLLLRNRAIGAAIHYVSIDVKDEEETIERDIHVSGRSADEYASMQKSIEEYEADRDATLKTLVKILLRFIPNVKSFRFLTRNKIDMYRILEEQLEEHPLRHMEVLQPPEDIRDVDVYSPVAWRLRSTLKKMTFINRKADEDASMHPFLSSDVKLVRNAKEFTNLTEIRVQLLSRLCSLPGLEMVLDAVPETVNYIVLSASFVLEPINASKIIFPENDTATIKPLPHVTSLRTLQGYFSDENTIKYIIHKFPNLGELIFEFDETASDYQGHDLTEIASDLSPGLQTLFFEYLMKMTSFDVFGIYRIEDVDSLMSRWTSAANTVENKRVDLSVSDLGAVDPDCIHIYWRKYFVENVYYIQILLNQESNWLYEMSIASIGSCLQSISLEYVDITSSSLSTIYRGCPLLKLLSFENVTILGPIDTGEVTSNLTQMSFQHITYGARYIRTITRNLPSLSILDIIDANMAALDLQELEEVEEEEEDRIEKENYKDLAFNISATHSGDIRCVPDNKLIALHGLIPPWCFIINDKSLYLNPDAFTEDPYRTVVFTEKVPLCEFEDHKKKIAPSKRDQSYCVHIKCKEIYIFQISKYIPDIPRPRQNDFDKPAENALFLVINE